MRRIVAIGLAFAAAACTGKGGQNAAKPGGANEAAGPGKIASAEDIERWMTEEKFPFRTVEPGKRWTVPFDAQNVGSILVVVIHGPDVTSITSKFFTVPP